MNHGELLEGVNDNMTKGKPLRTGSGRGVRANRGRGGCKDTSPIGKGREWFNRNTRRFRNRR